ncbi:hypothetical protein CHS0354_013611 [Potamilus streckersoni]|uniref:GTPase-activating protein and VPS9 domain-containing protein 1 n=1 Tax=Potamilus streckersoni TaxID=2493646 RepID=A0AAE0VXL1_9BIVA|nr:hypothetical protein CHS0354_013611 [Potamilus streckersoni]
MALGLDLVELARHLKQERLYVTSEKEQVQNLYEEVKKAAEELYHESWISRQQKAILDALILSTKEVTPSECFARTNQLDSSNFVDGYKHLSYHDAKFGELLKFLRENPVFLGHLLAAAEKANMEPTINIIKVVMTTVYGSCVLQADEIYALQMLKCLLELQLNTSDDPRRLVRRGSCAFSVAFKQLFDSVFSAKLFLTAALHDPVMRLLMEDEWFYDIDPGKALIRFPPQERHRRFGDSGTEEYKHKLQSYRKTIVEKLVYMASRFISSLKNNMHCFPPGLGWLVSQVYQVLTKNSKLEISEVRAICTDLVFALFICPAICDPEPHGITTDVPISHIARHNLMQMAQIVQVLAISQWEEIDSKVYDLYSKFEKNCMSSLLDSLLDGLCPELPSTQNTQLPCLSRCSVLITLPELSNLVIFLRNAFSLVDEALPERKLLEDFLGTLPTLPLTPPTPVNSILNVSPSLTPKQTPPGTPVIHKKRKKKSIVSMISPEDLYLSAPPTPDQEPQAPNFSDEVLVVSLGNDTDCPGMLSEQKVISWEQENRRRRVKYHGVDSYDVGVGTTEIQEKRTRFSLSHDQESIGNTSDIQEAISEAASTHSVASIDLENDNDNFSDMISANVSGRGSPNISGRDTPLSQAESIEGRPLPAPNLPETVQKRNREDVTERFGKFEIKAELESDEIKSTVSDTWSTDVLASDSEPPEQNQQVRLEEIAEEMGRHLTPEHIDMSETASDAWSTDVLASDIDDKQVARLSEFDQDDVGSVTEFGAALEEMDIEAGARALDEETPLASGRESPTEEKLSAVGDFNVEGTTATMGRQIPQIHTNVNNIPAAHDSVFESPVNDGIQGNNTYDSNRLFVPPKKKQASFSPSLASERPVSNPVCLPDEYSALGTSPSNTTPRINSGRWSSELVHQNGSQVVGTETGARPKEQKYPSYPLKKPKHKNDQGDNLDFDMKRIDISQNGNEGVIGRYSADSGVLSVEIESISEVTYQISDLKLTEQQNSKLNENRFSASMAYFDPLSSENEVVGDLLEGVGSPNLQSFQDVIKSENVNENSSSQSTMAFEFPVSRLTNEIASKGGPSSFTNEVFVKGDNPVINRRSSTDSSQSSGSGISKEENSVDKPDRSSLDNSIQMSEEKESGPEEDAGNSSIKKKGGLFKTFKNKFQKGMKKKGPKSDREQQDLEETVSIDKKPTPELNIVVTEYPVKKPPLMRRETSDEILAKYRKKSILTSTPTAESLAAGGMTDKEKQQSAKEQEEDSVPLYDPNNLENCPAYLDAKRKLRMVLSTGDFQLGFGTSYFGIVPNSPRDMDHLRKENNDLVYLLRAQLSEAINLQNKATIAQLHEALRCVRQFDTDGCKKLVRSLQEDYQGRSSYVAYLVRCKQGLLTTCSHLQRLLSRIKREKEICNKYLTNVCLRFFMEFRERNIMSFISDFQKLTVSDEKTDFVERFLQFLNDQMARDAIWQAANNAQIEDAQLAIERYIMSRIYTHAMYPNGDGDILRDQLYHQHIIKLSSVITPQHSYMRIPRTYHLECPWPAAQREIYMINAYKTPKDKIQCVVRCSTTIMNLLSMANEKSVPAADDFMPVLIYVIIKANPPCLLSTIQYVNSFYEKRLAGEEQYWWMQFSSAVEFIKTMDYSEC